MFVADELVVVLLALVPNELLLIEELPKDVHGSVECEVCNEPLPRELPNAALA